MTAVATTHASQTRHSRPWAGVIIGVAAFVGALLVAVFVTLVLIALGVTSTEPMSLGTWLTGTGLWGGWSQQVVSDLPNGAGWTVWVAGAPLLITAGAGLPAAMMFRRWQPGILGVITAAITTAALAAVLVWASSTTDTTTNAAGSVSVREGLTWWWTGDLHPGTIVGAALLLLVIGLTNTVGLSWWQPARHVAWAVVVAPGLILTVALLAGTAWLTSSISAAATLGLLFPLSGTLAVFAMAGVPVTFGLTRVAPDPYVLTTWQAGPVIALVGILVVVLIAAAVGWVLRRRHDQCPFWSGTLGAAAFAGWLALMMDAQVMVPPAIGAQSTVSVNPLAGAIVGGVMGAVSLAVRGRATATQSLPKAPEQPPAASSVSDSSAQTETATETGTGSESR
mgnify:CR=1 FL=1